MFKRSKKTIKKPVLIGKKNQTTPTNKSLKPQHKKNILIAFTSTHKGAGCTHICLGLAYMLSNRYKVALVEKNESGLIGFDKTYKLKQGKLNSKKINNVDVFFNETENLLEILKQGYNYIFVDYGEILIEDKIDNNNLFEIYNSDIKILVTQTREWQLENFANFIKYDKEMEDWIILANLSTKEKFNDLKNILKNINSKVLSIPYIEEIFNSSDFEELLNYII